MSLFPFTKVRELAKKIPGMKIFYEKFLKFPNDVKNFFGISAFVFTNNEKYFCNEDEDFIVSLTSFPGRIENVWITIESMMRQTRPPKKIVLVLADDDFPDRRVPKSIRERESRGLEILWVDHDIRSYKKLLPAKWYYPCITIITIDDDIFYQKDIIAKLISVAEKNPNSVIGHRGWQITLSNGVIAPYLEWKKANLETPEHLPLLTGCGGILYPPNLPPNKYLFDIESAEKLCPFADDIWFWAICRKSEIPVICIGSENLRELSCQRKSFSLSSKNLAPGGNDRQFKNAIDHFGLTELIR